MIGASDIISTRFDICDAGTYENHCDDGKNEQQLCLPLPISGSLICLICQSTHVSCHSQITSLLFDVQEVVELKHTETNELRTP